MRILVTGLPKNRGGIGTLLVNIAKCNSMQCNSNKVQFEFLLPEESEYKEIFDADGYRYYECPRLYNIIGYYSVLKKILSLGQYDYVWINNTSKVDLLLPFVAKRLGKARIIQHSHGISCEERGVKKLVFSLLEHIYGRKYEALIDIPLACSVASADYFYQNVELRNRCYILGNGIFTEKFQFNQNQRARLRSKMNVKDDDILVGAVGRLTTVKNYPFLIRLVSALPSHYKGIIVGDGEDRAILTEMIQQEDLSDRFLLVGQKDNVADYYSAMDIFAMPSFNEGLPFSIVEAQCAGLSCIASTGISMECNLTGNVHFASLERIDDWIGTITKVFPNTITRRDMNRVISEKGYDINNSYLSFTKLLEQAYVQEENNAP